MHDATPGSRLPRGAGVVVRPRLASDGRGVRRVARSAWRAALGGRAPVEFLAAVWRTVYGRERLALGLVDPRRDAFVAERDGRVIGYADGIEGSRAAGPRAAGPVGAYDLARVYVLPEAWGTGVGHALVDAVLAAARARGVARVELEVDAANARGLAWWERRGFVRIGAGAYELPPFTRPTVRLRRSSAPLPG